MSENGHEEFAKEYYTPLFASYAATIVNRTKVRTGRILDVGCGGGALGFSIFDQGDFEGVTFLDVNESVLERAKAREEALLYPAGCFDYIAGDVCDMSTIEDNTFSLVVSRGSMQFWPDMEKAIREIHRVLKPGGVCYIGGGVGTTYTQTARIDRIMERSTCDYIKNQGNAQKASDKRKKMRTRQCQNFAELFAEMNCSYVLINSKFEGGWFIFVKDDELNIW